MKDIANIIIEDKTKLYKQPPEDLYYMITRILEEMHYSPVQSGMPRVRGIISSVHGSLPYIVEKLVRYLNLKGEVRYEELTDVVSCLDSILAFIKENSNNRFLLDRKPTSGEERVDLYGYIKDTMLSTNYILATLYDDSSTKSGVIDNEFAYIYNIIRRLIRLSNMCNLSLSVSTTSDDELYNYWVELQISCIYDHVIDIRNYFHFLDDCRF